METQKEIKSPNFRESLYESGVSPHYGVQCIASLTLFIASALWRMVAIISNYATSTSGGNMATTWLISPRKQTSLPKSFPPSIPGTLWPINPLSDLQVLLLPPTAVWRPVLCSLSQQQNALKRVVSQHYCSTLTRTAPYRNSGWCSCQAVLPFFNLLGMLKVNLLEILVPVSVAARSKT